MSGSPAVQVNRELAATRVQGRFTPCTLDSLCQNCGCEMRGHFSAGQRIGHETACSKCPCQEWCCVHGGQITGIRAAG